MSQRRSMSEICRELAEAAGLQHEDIVAQLLRMAALKAEESDLRYHDPDRDIRGRLVGTWDWDIVNDQVYADGPFARLFGIGADQASVGRPIRHWLDAVHPDDLDGLSREIALVMKTGHVFAMEYRVIAQGQVHWLYARGRCTFDQAGRPVRFPGAVVDITHEKRDHERAFSIAPQ